MFSWTIQADAKAKASSEQVWAIWTDVTSWPKWDHELEWSMLEGPFKVGTTGKLKPKGWPASKFQLTSVIEGQSHSDKTRMPLTDVVFNHTVKPCGDSQVCITHQVTVSGLLAPLLWLTMRVALKKGLPRAVKTLASMAEENSAKGKTL